MMKRWSLAMISLLVVFGGLRAEQLAFPGATGFGRYAVGGRSGSVYHVTNLNDSGAGSLRDAVSSSNRIVVFDVSGVIYLKSRLVFKNNLYVAGQTAPGEGITVYGNGVSFSGADNTIVRYLRLRMGKNGDSGKDAAGIANGQVMIFDHLSVSWGLDETFSINSDGKGSLGDITIQNTIMSQGLLSHSAGGLIQADHITLYRNLYVDNSTRNNKIKGTNQYVNNIVYNWKNGCYLMGGDSEGLSYCNASNNLFINGPAVGGNAFTGGNANFHIYAADNWQDKNRDGVYNPAAISQSEYSGPPTFVAQPYDYPALPAYPGRDLIDSLLPTVGASLPYRDPVDFYVVNELRSFGKEGKLISYEDQLPIGVPTDWTVWSPAKPLDTDGDGMPDAWETANGTDPAVDDAMNIAANGYANIENYINSITIDDRQFFLRAPFVFECEASNPSSLTLTWRDYTEGEDGFVVEMMQDGQYREVCRIAAADYRLKGTDGSAAGSACGATTGSVRCVIGDLQPGTAYQLRACAYFEDGSEELRSAYTPVLTAKTQPEQVAMIEWAGYAPSVTWATENGGDWNFTADNWQEHLYNKGDNVLIAPSQAVSIALAEGLEPGAVVVGDEGDVTLSGAPLDGTGSVNKFGTGLLDMGSAAHTYTGASVLHGGILRFASLKNGGEASGIGASQEFAQNWIWDGGEWQYAGGNASTNRSAKVYQNTAFNIVNGSTVTMNGVLEGPGGITLAGGQVTAGSANFFSYEGATRIAEGGKLYMEGAEIIDGLQNRLHKVVMAGGTLYTKDKDDRYGTYYFPIEVEDDSYSHIHFHRNCSIMSEVSGAGTLEWDVTWLREYIRGSWDKFYGRLIANGLNSAGSSQLMLYNSKGIPNGVVELRGTAQVMSWSTTATLYLGGLSGSAGTFLSGTSKNTNSSKMTWIVGGANTDETFAGVIDNRCSASGYNGTTSVEKVGSGDWRLTGKNVHSGTTTVSGGRLIVDGSLAGSGAVTVKSGATLCGKGTVAGKVTVASGGVVAVFDTVFNRNNVFTLSAGCTVAEGGIVEVPLYRKETLNRASTIKFGAASTLSGTLRLDMTEVTIDIPENSYFTIFTIPSGVTLSGGFTDIEPAVPGQGLKWDLSELLTSGRIYIRNESYSALDRVEADVVSVRYYTLIGQEVPEPEALGGRQMLLRRSVRADGSVRTEKIWK
ncbi:MAG: autotransporter-associated beta strand repeat-containing protein [Bacteroidales bacterium]|nr:autotransporter-associated beta strand repeat-containing protein [Bacteroidales bacterium]